MSLLGAFLGLASRACSDEMGPCFVFLRIWDSITSQNMTPKVGDEVF
jgi:hypothetical protein